MKFQISDGVNFMAINKKLPENLTIGEASELRKELSALLEKGENNFIIDFANCNFIDSTGLGVLVAIQKRCSEQGGKILLCSINSPQIKEIFALTRLDKVFAIYPTYEDALKNC